MTAVQMDEQTALALMREGGEEGLRWMIRRYTPYVSAVVWGVFGGRLSAQDAEEVTSDTFLALWRSRDRVQPGKVKSHLGAVARTRAIDRLRKAGQDISLEDDTLVISADTPEREILLQESRQLLRHYLKSMNSTDREIFLRTYYLCEKAPTIARRLCMSPEAVRQRLSRGRKQLQRMFDEEDQTR